jgi:hypothetical protein
LPQPEPFRHPGVGVTVHGASKSDPWYSEVPVSDEKDPDREEADAPDRDPGDASQPGPDQPAGHDGHDGPGLQSHVDTDDDELDALDGDGFDRAVANARGRVADPNLGERPYTEEEAGLRGRVGWGRSPIISVAVIVVGLFLLFATWSDFRYFLRSVQSQPRDLGHVGDIYQDGEFTERFDDEWVILEGQPDVQHAARMPSRDGWVGFMRLVEGDASMFVAIPRETEDATNEFPGRFEGRMRRLDDTPQWEKLQTFFNAEQIVDIVNLAPASVLDALAGGGGPIELAEGGTTELAATDKLRLVVTQPVAMAQLGRSTWKTRAEADQAIAALGRPSMFVEKRDTVWVYAVEVGADASVEVLQQLTLALNGGRDLADPDPKVGALVLPRRTTYLADYGDLAVEGPALSFTYGSNTAETGWRLQGDKLVMVELQGGRLAVPSATIEAMRVERALKADPDGYLLVVDHLPGDAWPSALMFVAVLGVVLLNGWALAATLRRRRAARS